MDKPIKVFMLIKGLDVGGAEKLLSLALSHLNRTDFDYEVGYLVPQQHTLVAELEQKGIPAFCLGQQRFYDPRVIHRLARLLHAHRVDILHIHLPYPGVIGRIAGKIAGVKRIVYSEHSPVNRYHPLTRLASRMTYSWNSAVIAVSNDVRKTIEANYGVRRGMKIQTIYNGIDGLMASASSGGAFERAETRRELGIPVDHSVVVNVAGFRAEKGHFRLLRAARLILQQNPQVTFLLVGQGELETAVRTEVQARQMERHFVFAGYRTDVLRLLQASDLFVLPSDYEGLPVSLLEAMAAGLPVVSTSVGGIPEVVTSGVHGLLVSPDDPQELAQGVLKLLEEPETRLRMGRAGAECVVQQFAVQNMVAQTEELYRELLASG